MCSQNFVFTVGIVAFTIAITLGGQVLADRFELANGETIEGTLLNPNERPRRVWLVRSSDGTSLQFDADAVTHVTRETPVQKEFHKIVPEYPDTIEGQWKLAEWCQEKSSKNDTTFSSTCLNWTPTTSKRDDFSATVASMENGTSVNN